MTRYDKLLTVRTLERRFPCYRRIPFGAWKKAVTLLLFPFAAGRLLAARRRVILPYLELVLTERCSLRCKDCANLMQHYKAPRHYPPVELARDVEVLEAVTGALDVCQLLGGEPLLHPDFADILRLLVSKEFIRHIQVVTNGTVLPPPAALAAMKNGKTTVLVSNYGATSRALPALTALLAREGVAFQVLDYAHWQDYGDLSHKGLTGAEVAQSYRACASAACVTLLGGRLYPCPRSAHMANLGLLPAGADSLKLEQGTTAREVMDFYNRGPAAACAYCAPADRRAAIPPAVQKRGGG